MRTYRTADKQSEAGRARRRMFPIHMYVGRNGAGKSLCMVYDTLPDLDAGRLVLSTVRLLDWRNPRPCEDAACGDVMHGTTGHMAAHPCYVAFTDWQQLLDWGGSRYGERCGPVLMDEITGVADSNASGEMPQPVRNKLPQLRRDDIALRLTALNFIRADKRIREAVKAVTRCTSSRPYTVQDATGADRLWRPRKLAKYVTYDAESLPVDDHTAGAYDKADVLTKSRHWIPTSPARLAYDTYAPVLVVGTVTDAGRCAHCGGHRRAPDCACADYVDDRAQRKALASTPRQARSGRHGAAAA